MPKQNSGSLCLLPCTSTTNSSSDRFGLGVGAPSTNQKPTSYMYTHSATAFLVLGQSAASDPFSVCESLDETWHAYHFLVTWNRHHDEWRTQQLSVCLFRWHHFTVKACGVQCRVQQCTMISLSLSPSRAPGLPKRWCCIMVHGQSVTSPDSRC